MLKVFDGGAIPLQPAWRGLTGRGVKVALVDSGINASHSHVGWVAGGVTIRLNDTGYPAFEPGYQDRLGHGTALAGIIRLRAPAAHLYAVKIFENRLVARIETVIAALQWAIAAGMKVVNLSLGTEDDTDRPLLEAVCRRGAERGLIIVASGEAGRCHYPAALPMVIGVAMDPDSSPGTFSYQVDDPIEFRACGWPRKLPGLPQSRNLRGSSFAAAHIAALCTLAVEEEPQADVYRIRQILFQKGREISETPRTDLPPT